MRRLIVILCLLCCSVATAQTPRRGGARPAVDFPPGVFSDNGTYKLDDFKGKALVLFFYEQNCPSCRGTIPERNALVRRLKDKPVKFIAVAAGDSLAEARAYAADTKLAMPVFADPFSVMEKAYCDPPISLNNIYQLRVVLPDGTVRSTAHDGSGVEKLLDDVQWKYNPADYDAKLKPAIELLEWNQLEAGLKLLRPLRKDRSKDVAASAEKLYAVVKGEGEQLKAEADAAVESDPARAFDLYTRLKTCFADDDLGKSVDEPLKKLRTHKAVVDEQAARKQFARLQQALAAARPGQRAEVAAFCKQIAKQYPDAPSGKKAQALADQLGG